MMGTQTHYLEPKVFQFTFGINEPELRVHSDDTIVAVTRDARGYDVNREPLKDDMMPKQEGVSFFPANPLVGPIYVEEAKRGDALAVYIEKIKLNRPNAWSSHSPYFASLTGEGPGRRYLLNPPIEQGMYEWTLDLDRNLGILEMPNSRLNHVEIPLHPFIGSIGVAPPYGRTETSLAPGEYGGNMDCVDTGEDTTLYLPVWADGAYLAFGDIHAAQGDGELCGSALETTAEVTIRLEVIKNWQVYWPRIENTEFIMTAGSTRPLFEALAAAQVELLNWLIQDYGFDKWEAWQLNSQVGIMRIGNVVDPYYTVLAKFPKRFLPSP
jgi:acetamidase/formamidase